MTQPCGPSYTVTHLAAKHPLIACCVCACVAVASYAAYDRKMNIVAPVVATPIAATDSPAGQLYQPVAMVGNVVASDKFLTSRDLAPGLVWCEDRAIEGCAQNFVLNYKYGENPPMISFTFDDAHASDVYAANTLNENSMLGTFYIPTDFITGGDRLNSHGVKKIVMDGHQIGGHTKSHVDLVGLEGEQLISEVSESQEILSDRYGVKVKSLAYPYASYDYKVLNIATPYYTSAVAVGDGLNTIEDFDRWAISRLDITRDMTAKQVCDKVSETMGNQWLVLMFHDIKPLDYQNSEEQVSPWVYDPVEFEKIVQCVKNSQTFDGSKVVTIDEGVEVFTKKE